MNRRQLFLSILGVYCVKQTYRWERPALGELFVVENASVTGVIRRLGEGSRCMVCQELHLWNL